MMVHLRQLFPRWKHGDAFDLRRIEDVLFEVVVKRQIGDALDDLSDSIETDL